VLEAVEWLGKWNGVRPKTSCCHNSQKSKSRKVGSLNKVTKSIRFLPASHYYYFFIVVIIIIIINVVVVVISVQWDNNSNDGDSTSELLPTAVSVSRDASSVRWSDGHRQVSNHQQLPHTAAQRKVRIVSYIVVCLSVGGLIITTTTKKIVIDPRETLYLQGRLSPQQPWRSLPHFHVSLLLLPSPPPQTIFGHCIHNFVQFMRVFSEFWKLSVRNNDPPPNICFHF